MKTTITKLVAVFAIILSGCSATGPIFKEVSTAPQNQAIVYVYRPSALVNSAAAPNLFVNDIDHGPLLNSGYIPLQLSPGNTLLVLKGDYWKWGLEPISLSIRTEAGKTYYVRFGNQITSFVALPTVGGFYTRNISIQEVPEDFGKTEIAETKLSIDSSRSSGGPEGKGTSK